MGVPISQAWTVATYVLKQRLLRRKRYPLVLMLEPLFRCNLACAGCGKIQQPPEMLRRHLTPQQCFDAAEECGAPIVSIPGGEPLLHPQIDEIVAGLVDRRKYVYLCTNALKLVDELHRFAPSKYLSFSIHVDGLEGDHDDAVCREGVYDSVISAIRTAIEAGFRVTTNTTLFDGSDPRRTRQLFDVLTDLGVEGMMVSPGFHYAKAPDQDHFLAREQTTSLLRRILGNPKRRWAFNHSPLYLEYLQGRWPLECTPWGNPTYNLYGWQRPCYLLDEGYVPTFQQLIDETDWSCYGHASNNRHCTDCMVHSGHEPTAVAATFSSLAGLLQAARLTLWGAPRDGLLPQATPAIPERSSVASSPTTRSTVACAEPDVVQITT